MAAAELKEVEETALIKVKQESLSILDRAKALVVKDQESYNLATELYKAALEVEKAADAAHDSVVSHWFGLHRAAVAAKKEDKDLATQAKIMAKSKSTAWADEQERIRLAEERRLQEIARRQAEEEARIAREQAEAERKRLEAIEAEERLKLAQEAEQAGATVDQVTEILEAPLYIPEPEAYVAPVFVAPTVAPTFQKAAGVTARWNYSAKITNLTELVRAAAAQPHFMQYLQAQEQAINALARASRDAFQLPGCSLEKRRV
jgi:hypothetical protein